MPDPQSPLLLTPGPLTTSARTRAAASLDYGSRDPAFVRLAADVRKSLVALVAEEPEYTCVPVQGSGTFAVEATLGTLVSPDDHVAVLANGAYGERIAQICRVLGRRTTVISSAETEPADVARLQHSLGANPGITHVAVVYSETTTGLVNPVAEVARVAAQHGKPLIIDAMSAFGALPLRADLPFEAVVASSNKCLEGLPGVGFAIARRTSLLAAKGNAHSLALDLHDQFIRLEKDGQWRFTPPTHVLAALHAAIAQHAEEGGSEGRLARYVANREVLLEGMRALGFQTLLAPSLQGPIIVTFLEPAHRRYRFDTFYEALRQRGYAIYPGKLAKAASFRVGCIGQVFPDDLRAFVGVVGEVLREMGVSSGAP